MKLKSLSVLLLFISCIVISACKNTQAKVNEFVDAYNKQTLNINNQLIKRTYAENITHNTTDDIKIVFVLNIEETAGEAEVYKKMFPNLIASLLKSNRASEQLLKEGVKFEVVFCDIDRNVIKKETVDQYRVNEIYKGIDLKVSTEKAPRNNLSPELNQILVMLNKSLPIENKAEGTTMVKVDINEKNELVYEYEVNKEVQLLFKSQGFVEVLKEEILRNDKFKGLASQIGRYRINNVRFVYKDSNKKVLNEVLISSKDF